MLASAAETMERESDKNIRAEDENDPCSDPGGVSRCIKVKYQYQFINFCSSLNDVDNMEYKRIIVKGEFLHDRELLLGPRSMITDGGISEQGGGLITQKQETMGFHVVTPFKLEGRE